MDFFNFRLTYDIESEGNHEGVFTDYSDSNQEPIDPFKNQENGEAESTMSAPEVYVILAWTYVIDTLVGSFVYFVAPTNWHLYSFIL